MPLPVLLLALPVLPHPPQSLETWTLGDVEITRAEIYPEADRWLPRVINATHRTTREAVVRREIWKRPGDAIDEAFAAELERNLRATGLFSRVTVRLRPAGTDGSARDLVISTQDRLSLNGGASASFVGEVASGGVSIGESNLLGWGDRVRLSFFENDLGESRGVFSYRDRYVAGSWTTASLDVGRTDQGDFAGVRFDRPFRYLADRFSWSLGARDAELDRDYFFFGDNVAEVPFRDVSASADATWRSGTRERFMTYGVAATYLDREFRPGRGPAIAQVRVPGDTESTFAGATFSFTDIQEFRKATNLDTLEFVQDIQVGTGFSVRAGGTLRDEFGGEERVQPTVGSSLSRVWALGADSYASTRIGGSVRAVSGDAVGWSALGDARYFDRLTQRHTLAVGLRYQEADENEGLPVQLTLGENNGLRGYPNREFAGQRIVRLNVEDRIDLDVSLGTFDFGAVVFADAAWITARGEDLGDPLKSVGVGLRIGSTELLGSGVLRLDVSFPLDDFGGRSYDPLVSFSLGQVFGL